jgi:hypothetical protein
MNRFSSRERMSSNIGDAIKEAVDNMSWRHEWTEQNKINSNERVCLREIDLRERELQQKKLEFKVNGYLQDYKFEMAYDKAQCLTTRENTLLHAEKNLAIREENLNLEKSIYAYKYSAGGFFMGAGLMAALEWYNKQ